ncbi:nuclear mitotic apparatus protein 1 isoform X5 [Oncorhynchus tshawytscha]|uniref:nuclear mitotic apparatus protein 1 isoform X5 n=1 Tax=Oncorhynchus tshawytscha TaxID=74940 RepID=UPI001C3DCEA4|nr:nuclear mitotic apparatus protein 1 isoform X5 [Oncorhynchus tshawytscha]
MVLHLDKEHALLEWVNHLNVDLPVRSINDLQDGVLLLKLVYKLRKEEPAKSYLDQPIQERLKVVSDFLQGDCRCSTERGALISWDNISNGLNLEVELSKVLVLLYYHSVINNHVDLNQLEYKFEVELASMLRFVLDNENSLYLSENLEKYLRKKPLFSFNSDISSTSSSSLFNDEESPVFRRRKKIGSVQFLDLQTVASSSVSSPLQDVMNTPQFQLKKLQRQLRQERDMRDELEKDLTTSAATLTQRESQICQLQHRIEKLLREQAEQEQEPRDELQELHSKNEGLRTRLHEVLKECQALKTNSSQMERKVDNLTEENGTLSAQMREVIARLASAEAEVDRLTEAQDSAQGEWSSRHCHLQAELNRATAQKECLNEQMLILQSKISSLEDELSKAKMQEKGEVMGPILEWEQLKQELADATLRHAECECTIARLKGEKEQAATLHAQERASLQAESQRLQVLVTELQEALSALRVDREALELASKEERESLTAQLHTLTAEVASLTQTVQQREQEVQQECIQRGELNLAMEWQERKAREEIQELTSHVDTMGDSLRRAEEEVQVREKQLTKQQQESALQREVLQEEMAAAEKVLKELKEQEEAVREEATRLHQEITTHATNLCSLRQEHTALQEQLARQQEEISLEKEAQSEAHREKEAVREELSRLQEELRSLGEQMAQLEEAQREKECLLLQSTENIETLKTERATASSLAEAKDLELSSLREEVRAREEQLAMQQEEYRLQQEELREELAAQENEINNMRERLAGLMDQISLLKELCQEGKNMEALREEHTAQLEQLRIVKEQVEEVQERNEETSAALREKESSLREKEESLRRLEEELQSTTSLASQRRQEELTSLKEEVISQQEEVERRRAAEALSVEEARQLAREQESKRMELEESVSALQQQLDSAIQDNDRKRQECERLEQDLEHRGTRVEELRQQEDSARLEATRLRQEISTHVSHLEVVQRGKEELARQQEELRGEVSLHQQRASVLQQSLEVQEVAMRVLKEQTESTREEATVKMEALQAQLEVVSSLATAKDLQLSTLREEATALQEQLAKREQEISRQKEVLQEAHMEKESVEALREELARQQEELREELIHQQQRAQSLEQSLEEQQEALKELTVKEERAREEATLKMVALQAAKDLELSTLRQEATQLRQEISTHVSRLEEVQRGREEQEGNASEETTVKMEALQAQLEVVSSLATAKDLQLSTLREEATALQEQLAKREQEISLQKEVLQEAHLEKESVEALREELARQQEELREELIHQQQRAQSLEQSLEEQQEALKELTVKEERAREEATLKMVALQAAKDLELSTLRQEATQLRQEISTHVSRLEEVQSEGPLREEHTALQVQLAKQQEENSLQKGLLQEVQATVLQEREAKEILRGEVSLHQQSLEHQEAVLREDLARQKEEGQAAGQVEKELMEQFSVLQQEKEALLTRALQAEQNQSELEGSMAELRAQAESTESGQRQQLDALLLEKERLTEGNQVLEMKCSAAQRLEAVLQEELALLREQMEGTEWEKQVRHLREQLAANTEVVEHYKTQVEKAKSHYSGKKQQLVESQEQVTELQRSLEVREHEVNAVTTEMKLLQKELEKARSKEKSLGSKINTLEAQLAFADRHLREQSQVRPERGPGRIEKMRGGRESVYLKVPQSQTHQETSGDSLDLSLDDSLNTTTRPMEPDESSTPLVRSSERVAAKRRALGGDSLETLYFTPMNNRQINRTSTERRLQSSITSLGELALDSARKRPPTSSARRRRTTQVINITMSKTTPGRRGAGEDSDNETFYSLASVHSHPNITGRTHTARPVSMEIFHTPGKPAVALSDQLLSLPGYRRSTVHVAAPQSTGQFCVGAENEPDHAADDWLRIAELQARNQSCLPHLKSSYPLESRPSLGPSFEFTDDDLRMGDPTETIRRASVMPGQIQESLSSHRLSLHPGPADSTTATRPAYGSHRLSLMPPKPKASSTLNNQNTHNLRGSNLSLKRSAKDQEPDTPEAKRMATSCFPRPLTPKGGRFSSSNNRQPLSPAERRQSTVFSIDNTPRKAASKSGFLQRGMSKIRSSTRKSPGNKSSRVPQSGDRKSPRSGAGSVKSPQPGGKAQRKSPRTNSSKSPKNPTSARKEPEVLVGKPIHLSR